MRILGVAGSLRKGSSNTALLFSAKNLADPSVEFDIYDGLADLPHFNPDLDVEPLPVAVQDLRKKIASTDAILISTPEYAHGIPGSLKNALDWLVSDVNFAGKRVGLLFGSATDGSFARAALIEVLNTMSAKVIDEAVVSVSGARVKFDSSGNLIDSQVSAAIRAVLKALRSDF